MTRSTLLKNARVIDGANGLNEIADVFVKDGCIAEVAPDLEQRLPANSGVLVLDLEGLLVTPGLVDIHAHLFATAGNPDAWAGEYSVWPDCFSFRTGVTTMVDAGSAGWRNFGHFCATVAERAKTRIFAAVNIAGHGMVGEGCEQYLPELEARRAADACAKYAAFAVAIKTAHYAAPGWDSVDRAIEAGELSGLPVMVDFGYFVKERPYWRLVTEKMRPGDISTHCFRGPVPVVDDEGVLYPYLKQARDRGVLFDLGHGAGSFLFRNAAPAFQQGFYPDSISTDLHTFSMNEAMIDMPTTISKCMALGMPIKEAIDRSTRRPAEIIGHKELGTLSVGSEADIAVWRINERPDGFGFKDSVGARVTGYRRLECEMTFKSGTVVWDLNARVPCDYAALPSDSGVRPGEFIVTPE
ncbi:amidohydrolase [Synergistales bacterium]|nr:amidohydrolase [Synergistales bacterium]